VTFALVMRFPYGPMHSGSPGRGVRLYVAFWLQLGSIVGGRLAVACLAHADALVRRLPKRPTDRATLIGSIMSFGIAGLFPRAESKCSRLAFGWIWICVFVASYLLRHQAYSAYFR